MPVWRKQHEVARVSVHYAGMIITAVATSALYGKLSNYPTLSGWGDSVPMSIPTAFCLVLTGIGFFLLSRGEAIHGDGKR